jgi:hypothetical protein
MKRAKITTKNILSIYEYETQNDLGLKAAIIVEMYDIFTTFTTAKSVIRWIQESRLWYGKYFVILVNDTLTLRDKKNIDKVILDIDLSEMEA